MYQRFDCIIFFEVHIIHSHLDFFPDNDGKVIDEYEKCSPHTVAEKVPQKVIHFYVVSLLLDDQ